MPDNVDFIQEQQAELLERQINAARVKHCGVSALVCEECDANTCCPSCGLSVSHALCFLSVSL